MTSGELAKDVLEAEEQLEQQQERKAEIDGRYNHYLKLKVKLQNLFSVVCLNFWCNQNKNIHEIG